MKYAIIAAIIAAVVAILLLLFDIGLAKTDKNFIALILVLLVISGVYFTIADIRKKDSEQTQQTEVQSTTLKNTVELNSKADSIILGLNESLEKAILLKNNINKSNTSLSNLEKDIKTQIDVLGKTLVQTKIFEQKVSEQLKIDKQRFSLEKAKLSIISQNVKFKETAENSGQFSSYYLLRNIGKREAIDIKQKSILMLMDKSEKFVGTASTPILVNCNKIAGIEINRGCDFTSDLRIPELDLIEKYSNILLIVKVTYKDESDKEVISENFYFQWSEGKQVLDLEFHSMKNEYKEKAISYIKAENIKDVLID